MFRSRSIQILKGFSLLIDDQFLLRVIGTNGSLVDEKVYPFTPGQAIWSNDKCIKFHALTWFT